MVFGYDPRPAGGGKVDVIGWDVSVPCVFCVMLLTAGSATILARQEK